MSNDGDWFERMVEFFSAMVGARIKETVHDFTHTSQSVVYQTIRNVLKLIFMGVLGLVAIILIVLAAILLTRQYTSLSTGWILLIVSAVVLFTIAIIGKKFEDKKMFKF